MRRRGDVRNSLKYVYARSQFKYLHNFFLFHACSSSSTYHTVIHFTLLRVREQKYVKFYILLPVEAIKYLSFENCNSNNKNKLIFYEHFRLRNIFLAILILLTKQLKSLLVTIHSTQLFFQEPFSI